MADEGLPEIDTGQFNIGCQLLKIDSKADDVKQIQYTHTHTHTHTHKMNQQKNKTIKLDKKSYKYRYTK